MHTAPSEVSSRAPTKWAHAPRSVLVPQRVLAARAAVGADGRHPLDAAVRRDGVQRGAGEQYDPPLA